ncbi:HD-GYP domain-containing protein [Hydrogenophaga laconesensis]|uniref:HD-GYP domain-containing protein (C-di-GMP phosphodiesterase class II) n=1 Tax=Hydrogenophaga laconesensis TaxID=1805971 RepID=A0ABU1V5D5_9BURK|nr:HD domain-containing phosphohydrolase [Hydrogenophaga laconesensis]MDR7092543.1 HD-GYP domain-containing protein (c-di-GMP phosphodiesterase class II) [Hydrogenophaga laconesensis]
MYKSLPLDALALQQPVPVNVWDPKGVLLLRKGEAITSEQHRGLLMLHSPVVLEADWRAWSYGYTAELDRMVRGNETLSRIAGLSHAVELPNVEVREEDSPVDAWADLHAALNSLLQQGRAATHFNDRIERLSTRALRLWRDAPDDSLLVLVQLLFDVRMGYSASHALLAAGLCALVAPSTGLSPSEQAALFRAALTMNIGMTRTHDIMARQSSALTDMQRQTVREHPLRSAAVLRELGVQNALWLQLVEEQHEKPDGSGYPTGKRVTDLPQRLLQMADVYAACISPRQGRGGLLSQQVARELYLGPDQQPDALAALFVKHIGFYPPGSYVRLASGEVAVVTRRGAKANAPQVFAIVGKQGMPLGEPTLRDPQDPAHEIRASLSPGDVRVMVNVPRLLSRR